MRAALFRFRRGTLRSGDLKSDEYSATYVKSRTSCPRRPSPPQKFNRLLLRHIVLAMIYRRFELFFVLRDYVWREVFSYLRSPLSEAAQDSKCWIPMRARIGGPVIDSIGNLLELFRINESRDRPTCNERSLPGSWLGRRTDTPLLCCCSRKLLKVVSRDPALLTSSNSDRTPLVSPPRM